MKMKTAMLTATILLTAGSAESLDIHGELTGYMSAGIYTVTGNIYVPSGESLTLAPGVIFEFETGFLEDYEFNVNGSLIAIGTAENQIVFKPADGVDEYNYIKLSGEGSHLEWCVIEGAGRVGIFYEGGLWIDNRSPLIKNCMIHDGSWHGIYVTGSSACPVFENCTIFDNSNDGVDCDLDAGLQMTLCEITGNGTDGICLSSGSNQLVNCLIAGNGEDGIDCHWLTSHPALIVNCTIGFHPGGGLNSASLFEMYNCVVVDEYDEVAIGTHTYIIDNESFLSFIDPGNLDFRLADGSSCLNSGYRFGTVAALLPDTDLDGNPRMNGIIDIGAYESTSQPSSGEEGIYFSSALVSPRMTQAVIRKAGESFTIQIALLGDFGTGDAAVHLVSPMQEEYPLSIMSVNHRDRTPDSDLFILLYGPGIERIQEVEVLVPVDTPEDFYDIVVDLGSYSFHSIHAVKVLEEYPETWSFMHITDPHIDYDNSDYTTAQRFRRFIKEANFLDPEFIVHTGDACENEHLGTYFNDSLLQGISQLRVPFIVIAGNHDHYNWTWISYNPCGYLYFFQLVNRVMNCEFRFGNSLLYCINSGHDEGLLELARCYGPTTETLDWIEDQLVSEGGSRAGPFFFLTHGPTFDFYMWSLHNTDRVVDLLDTYGFSLALAGHTHRIETYLNQGNNYYGRNDFFNADDWVRDVPFPGFPLHVQTSSLGKGDGLGWPDYPWPSPLVSAQNRRNTETGERDFDSDSIAWRWIHVVNDEVDFFTSDTDDDGYRNTEKAWLLGRLMFEIDSLPGGSFLSTVTNNHFETWFNIHHYIPADPSVTYEAQGGILLRQYPDGTVEVLVDEILKRNSSEVLIVPVASHTHEAAPAVNPELSNCFPNPFSRFTEIGFGIPAGGADIRLEIIDLSGRTVDVLLDEPVAGGWHNITWNGTGESGEILPAGVYFCVFTAGEIIDTERMILIH